MITKLRQELRARGLFNEYVEDLIVGITINLDSEEYNFETDPQGIIAARLRHINIAITKTLKDANNKNKTVRGRSRGSL